MQTKKAIVTGASRGIGKGIAHCLAKEGYDLAISYASKKEEAEAVSEDIRRLYGRECYCFAARLEKPGAGVELFAKATEALGGLDLMVNNAGITLFESLLEMTEETMDFLIALDFKNYLLMAREAARYMAKRGTKGSIINITSSRAERAYPGDALYGALKAGLSRAIQSMALDIAPYGIRINNVAPGAIRVRSKEELQQKDNFNDKLTLPLDFWDTLSNIIPLERSGEPQDIGDAVCFLASEKASYITGVTLRVDGGLILPGMPEFRDESGADRGWGYTKKLDF